MAASLLGSAHVGADAVATVVLARGAGLCAMMSGLAKAKAHRHAIPGHVLKGCVAWGVAWAARAEFGWEDTLTDWKKGAAMRIGAMTQCAETVARLGPPGAAALCARGQR